MSAFLLILLCLSGHRTEEVPTPSSLLAPRNFNHHSYDIKKYLQLTKPEPTKQGPVLFPNDAPPPPRPPLVVTSRPLVESIARSDLNPDPPLANNTVAEQSQISHVAFKPFWPRLNQYPASYTVAPLVGYDDVSAPGDYGVPYAELVDKVRGTGAAGNRYNVYEDKSSLPPIYKALSDYAQNQLKIKAPTDYDYKSNGQDYGRSYEDNGIGGEDHDEYNQGENYAFSYHVKDRKTGDDFSHRQHSSGSATNGEYRVRLPDGRMQIVSYTADQNGYKADVRYDNDDVNNHQNQIETKHNNYGDTKNYEQNVKYNDNRYKDYQNEQITKDNPVIYNYNSNNEDDYTQRDFNVKPVKEDYYNPYTDTSKEYYNDYSLENPNNYDTHRSKFDVFKPSTTPAPIYSTVRPSYDEIKNLFTVKPNAKADYINDRAVEINVPSTNNYDGITENVVVIAPKLYTHVRSSTPLIDTINTTPKPFIVTPASYLASTIASIKERIKSSKPILSNAFIQRINKYLTFT